jgi:sulfhydrogenase subunit beta (sulfur reductase)
VASETNPTSDAVLAAADLNQLFEVLAAEGYEVLGPTLRNGAIVIEQLTSATDLPQGWGDHQDGGIYRVIPRPDAAYFGFATPASTWKRYLFPPKSVLWRSRLSNGEVSIEETVEAPMRRAFLGIRGCDLAAIAVQDRVFLPAAKQDPVYANRRANLLLIGVNCNDPTDICFCASMGTGPAVKDGADLILTELDPSDPERHRFLIQPRTERGEVIVEQLPVYSASEAEFDGALRSTDSAAARIKRSMNTVDLPPILRAASEHPRWDDVAERCLACGNCTIACPTCFCADISDQPLVLEGVDERVREWSSCFELSHSFLHGGSLRVSTKSRYRQWMTHKLSTWWDQFDVSGCVGCGRCIAWCPVGIDITEEVRAIRSDDLATAPTGAGS